MQASIRTLAALILVLVSLPSQTDASETAATATATPAQSAPAPSEKNATEAISVGNSNALRERVGVDTTVYGIIGDVGYHAESQITFLNFRGNARGDFVCIVRGNDLQGVLDGLSLLKAEDLIGQTLEISGLITLHRETPQIEVKSAEQVRVVQ